MVSENKGEVVIDLESEDLTYQQARSIRLKIEKDVMQLQNRVRMLQQEETRAKKKIDDTRKKTADIRKRIEQNDEAYLKKIKDAQSSKIADELSKQSVMDAKMRSTTEIRVRAQDQQRDKLKAVAQVRMTKEKSKAQLNQAREAMQARVYERK